MTGVTRTWFAPVLLAGILGGGGFARAAQSAEPPWLQEISAALDGPNLHLVAAAPGENDKRLGLTHPLAPQTCVTLPVSDAWTVTVDIRFEPRRTYRMVFLAGLLPPGVDGYAAVLHAAEARRCDCLLPKSGNSVLQVGRVWLAFPSVCSDIYPHEHALPLVVAALRNKLGGRVSGDLIWGSCGWMAPVELMPVSNFVVAKGKRHRQPNDQLHRCLLGR